MPIPLEELLQKKYIVATGHRPQNLGGKVDDAGGCNPQSPVVKKVIKELEVVLIEKIEQGHTDFLSGAALGFDSIFFWVVQRLKNQYPHLPIKNIVAVPFRDFPNSFWKKQRHWYNRMLEVADEVIYVTDLHEYNTNEDIPADEYSIPKLKARNQFMVDLAVCLVAYCIDDKSGTGQAIRMAMRQNVPIRRLKID